jgi:hypothetical protein
MSAQKLTFQEAWDSSTIFFADEELENEIDEKVAGLLRLSQSSHISGVRERTVEDIVAFLEENPDGLDVILRDIGLSDEKFMRIISLLRKIGRIPGEFDSEWGIAKIKRRLASEPSFIQLIASLVFDGKRDQELSAYIPRYYLNELNYREIGTIPQALREVRYKESTIGTYGARKGHKVEAKIKERLEEIKTKYGVGYESGASRILKTYVDFAIPSLQDAWIVIISSFQEVNHPFLELQFEKQINAYFLISELNASFRENRVFINFVDGGGWLARKRDLERLVAQCHYFINLQNLEMLEAIVLAHVPKNYFSK